MSDLRQAAQQARTVLANARDYIYLLETGDVWPEEEQLQEIQDALASLRAALAEPEQSVEQALEALNKMQSIGLMMADGRHPRDVLRSFIHGAAPTPRRPEGWLRAVDEAMVVHHLGVADETDDYETAKRKLNSLLCLCQQIGEDIAATPRMPLSLDEIQHCADEAGLTMTKRLRCFARAIERYHGITGEQT